MDANAQNTFSMTLAPQGAGKVILVTLSGRLDTVSVGRFKAAILDAAQAGQVVFVIDCGGLRFLDSSGLGALVSLLRQLGQKNCDIKLAALTPEVKSLFMLTRLNKVFDIYETAQAALESCG